jgi:hypothetical protein
MNRNGRKIGSIEVRSDGLKIARNKSGRKLGEYNEDIDITFDANGRRYGTGNQLSALITEDGED